MQTIGERLEEARKRKGVSIREAAEGTKIRGDYLQKFESNQFDLGLAELYVRGFLRSYAQFLKLPADKIVNDFNGLGLSANGRPRTPSREVYGRMDLSVASTDESPAGESPASAPEAESIPVRRNPSSFTRGGGTLQAGPAIDPNLLFKGGIALAAVIVVLLAIWIGKAIFSGSGSHSTNNTAQSAPAAIRSVDNRAVITALDVVRVQAWTRLADDKHGEELLPAITLARGESASFVLSGPVVIFASARENIQIDYAGGIFLPGSPANNARGAGQMKMDPPANKPVAGR